MYGAFFMKKVSIFRKKLLSGMGIMILIMAMVMGSVSDVNAENANIIEVNAENTSELMLTAKAAILLEASTGKVLYEQNADEVLSPASITKIMTLILIFDALEAGKIQYDDLVTTSEYAKSMGGSQVFLETGEQQTVETLIKCIVVASGNDASVCMAEYIAGSESEFVRMMNERAQGLGMTNTVFLDCCGLNDTMEHHTSARDVAIMSRELITKYPQIQNYTKIWMENITHVTNKGSSEFTLANTNKLLKQYQWTTGLKTGSTSLAKYCLSATASKDGVDLIAVIMGAPDYKTRFSEAMTLLNYGFASVQIFKDSNLDIGTSTKVKNGIRSQIGIRPEAEFTYVCDKNENMADITKKIEMKKNLKAPIKEGEVVGNVSYYIGEKQIGSIAICSTDNLREIGYMDYLKKMWYNYMV